MTFNKNTLKVEGSFGFATGVKVAQVRFLNVQAVPKKVAVNGKLGDFAYDTTNKVLDVTVGVSFDKNLLVEYS
jgi:alpha-glucosidase